MASINVNDPNALFAVISKQAPEWLQKFTAHIRAVTGTQHANLVLYHNNGSSDDEKLAVYKQCLLAVMKGDPSLLLGSAPSGQTQVAVADPHPLPNRSSILPTQLPVEPPAVEEVAPRVRTDPDPVRTMGDDEVAAAQLVSLLKRVSSRSVDEGRVREIVDEAIAGLPKPDPEDARELVQGWIREALEQVKPAPRQVVEVRRPEGTVEIDGLAHRQLPQIVTWVAAGIPLWVWGAAGAGKTHLFYQVAKALDLTPRLLPCDETLTVAKLIGYRNLVNGEFIDGLLGPAYRLGGLQGFDEIDVCAPAIACINSLIANQRYLFPDGETVEKHGSWHCLAFANTKGVGATAGYSARNRLDAATLDRFAIIELQYDSALEMAIATGTPAPAVDNPWKPVAPASEDQCRAWVEWVGRVREAAGTSVLVSPRASINGVRALKAGIPADEVADALVFKLVTPDTKQRLIGSAGEVPK